MSDPMFDEIPILQELGTQLVARFESEEPEPHNAQDPLVVAKPRTRRRRRSLAAVLAVPIAALIATLVAVTAGGAPKAHSELDVALVDVATVARQQPTAFPTNNQFYFVSSVTQVSEPIRKVPTGPLRVGAPTYPRAIVTTSEHLWFSAGRNSVMRTRVLATKFPDHATKRLWQAQGSPSFAVAGSSIVTPPGHDRYLLGNIEVTRAQLLSTTTDPQALYKKLLSVGGSTQSVFSQIADTLSDRPAPPQLRAALYRTMALVPGIQLLGTRVDSDGRSGTAVALVTGGVRQELIFDPRTSNLLETKTLAGPSSGVRATPRTGTQIATITYLQRSITNTAP
jgi:hypothetical protein